MAYHLTIPFHIIQLQFTTGGEILSPLMEQSVVRMGMNPKRLTAKFTHAFQKKIIDKGVYEGLLAHRAQKDFTQDNLEVSFPGTKERDLLTHPPFTLNFQFIYQEGEAGYWAIIPSLGVEIFASTKEEIKLLLEQNVKLDFTRKKRLDALQGIISSIWFDEFEIIKEEAKFKIHTPTELEAINVNQREELLPKVATELFIARQVTFGRDKELDLLKRAFKGSFHRNVLLVGPSGVGKTALIWEMVRRKKEFGIKTQIWETTASTLIKELTRDTGWQDNLSYLCRELSAKDDFLFVRNLLEMFEVGQYEGNSVSMADYLREFINRGEINIISECTEEEFARIESITPNYVNLFQIIRLQEPKEDIEDIIIKKVSQIAYLENVSIEKDAIEETIRLNRRYTPYSGFPGKPIRFLESILLNQKSADIANSIKEKKKVKSKIDRTTVLSHFCEETGMPMFMVDPNIPFQLEEVNHHYKSNLFGQDQAVDHVIDLVASVKAGLTRSGQPIASFLFVGPTGVGKTEMAKLLASFMFGSREKMVRFDMSEYSNPNAVGRLTGLSYNQDGTLTSAVRRNPFSVLLFDEIEKADASFYDLLLQILGEGRLTDSRGKLVNFCSTIIIMTSNIGAKQFQTDRIGWSKNTDLVEISDHFTTAVQKHFRPELYNRIDKIIPFHPIGKEVVQFVVQREIELLKKREGIKYRRMDLSIQEEVIEHLAIVGYDPKYGARQLQRTIQNQLTIPLSQQLNLHDFDDQLIVDILLKDDKIAFQIEADPLKIDLLIEELERIEWTDHVSDLRRAIYKLQEGKYYISLVSKLYIFEQKKSKLKSKFWERQKNADEYAYFLHTKERVDELTRRIEDKEKMLALMAMDLKPYNLRITEETKLWEKDYLALKLELYKRMHPKSDYCYLSIYGFDPKPMIEFYRSILDAKNFDVEYALYWHHESYYFQEVEVTKAMKDDGILDLENLNVGDTFPMEAYYMTEYTDYNKINWEPPKPNFRLIGAEIFIKGKCAYLYFSEENGLMKWEKEPKKFSPYLIQSTQTFEDAPKGIFRKKFFEKRRTVRTLFLDKITDQVYGLNRQISKKGKFEQYLIPAMDLRFGKHLEDALN